jgi:hypothetical protein
LGFIRRKPAIQAFFLLFILACTTGRYGICQSVGVELHPNYSRWSSIVRKIIHVLRLVTWIVIRGTCLEREQLDVLEESDR